MFATAPSGSGGRVRYGALEEQAPRATTRATVLTTNFMGVPRRGPYAKLTLSRRPYPFLSIRLGSSDASSGTRGCRYWS